jgi:hypothetical protein
MTLQYSTTVRDAQEDAVETSIGAAPIMEWRTGAPPANCAAAASGTLLAQFALPSDWMAASSGGTKGKTGTWSGTGLAAGTAGHFRILRSGSPSVCDVQGTITGTGGGGDLIADNTSVGVAQTITVSQFDLTAGNP